MPFGELPPVSSAMAIGWGQIADGNHYDSSKVQMGEFWVVLDDPGLVTDLRYVYVTSVSNPECKIVYGDQITENMVCAAGNYNEGTCFVYI